MSQNNALVSVVIPTYNRAHIVLDALKSIHQQSYRPIELILVDDGSTDNTASVVQHWIESLKTDDRFLARYVHQSNKGGNPARNLGIREASGQFVAFLDSDDLWQPEKLTKQMDVLQSDNRIGGVYCGLRHIFMQTGIVQTPPPRAYPCGDLKAQMLVRDVTAPTSTYLVRASAFERVGCFDELLQARQDWDMWIRLAANYQIGVVPEVLVDFREHGGDRTASNPQREIDAYQTIMKKYAMLRSQCPLPIRQAAKAAFYRRMGRVHFHYKQAIAQAFIYQFRAIISWPFIFDSYAALFGMLLPKNVRQSAHSLWNRVFGSTALAVKSH